MTKGGSSPVLVENGNKSSEPIKKRGGFFSGSFRRRRNPDPKITDTIIINENVSYNGNNNNKNNIKGVTSPVVNVQPHQVVDNKKPPLQQKQPSTVIASDKKTSYQKKDELKKQQQAALAAAAVEANKKKAEQKKTDDPKKAVKRGKTYCSGCKKKCSGEVLKIKGDKYFHIECFKCTVCNRSLVQGLFFSEDGSWYCPDDYQKLFGKKCTVCNDYIKDELVIVLGQTYHQQCFTCSHCRQPCPKGDLVTYVGKSILCSKCKEIPVKRPGSAQSRQTTNNETDCAECGEDLKNGQALYALDKQWHIYCFKCHACSTVLHGEYMGRDGVPYCEKDYQKLFGVKCTYCSRFISGKVLQAGDNHHFHPTCARCAKCGDPFGDGEEMYLQGGAIWHPRCGPGPTENGTIINGGSNTMLNGHCNDPEEFDRISCSAASETQFSLRSRSRASSFNGSCYNGSCSSSMNRKHYYRDIPGSPGLLLREYKTPAVPISRIYTYSYLTEEPTQGYLKRPIDPYDKHPTSPHFHRPTSCGSVRGSSKCSTLRSAGSRTGMRALIDSIRSETPRPKSPHSMNNEEPIELAHYPAAKPPAPGEKPKIERDDFPAPPCPYTDPEKRKIWFDSYKGISDDEDEVDNIKKDRPVDPKLKKEEEELRKMGSGIGKVFLQEVREREKHQKWKVAHIDPRNASRCPSAAREPTYRLRYQSPINASPSRNLDHQRPWEEDGYLDSSYRSSVGQSTGAIPSYNIVSALRHVPKPGYGLAPSRRSNTFSSAYCIKNPLDGYSINGLDNKTLSTDFNCARSEVSAGSISEVDQGNMCSEIPASSTYTGSLRYATNIHRSLPNMSSSHHSSEPPKIYPYHLLLITNYRLPSDVDRCNLERHLSPAEFEAVFQMSPSEFYRFPQWRRNELKRRARLF
ncbi:actin-binding LIM protein 3 isoform X3 [Daktulosphaira vitifoliae]|uniref:actin-binding LIM protein 3 isoform X3 n=1 Tax=Daktulosphaira vitifoliae TaxID=58002 RepID=UPI0021AADD49|nr:actin-binding LIM protein 3 isoform X3 [Daktulosphaira vitifoliae]